MGRFTTPDPLGFPDGANQYAFVLNSPLSFTDPYGLARDRQGFYDRLRAEYDRTRDRRVDPPFGLGEAPSRRNRRREIKDRRNGIDRSSTQASPQTTRTPRREVVDINGMNTSREEAMRIAANMASTLGVDIELIYSKTHGIFNDVIEADFFRNLPDDSHIFKSIKSLPETSQKIAWKILSFYGRSSEEDRLIFIAHSRGCLDLKMALNVVNKILPQATQRVITVAVAPATLIDQKDCAKVYNLVSHGDIVTLTAPNYGQALEQGNMMLLKQKGNWLNTHGIETGPFKEAINTQMTKLKYRYQFK